MSSNDKQTAMTKQRKQRKIDREDRAASKKRVEAESPNIGRLVVVISINNKPVRVQARFLMKEGTLI